MQQIIRDLEKYHSRLEYEMDKIDASDSVFITEKTRDNLKTRLAVIKTLLPVVRTFLGCLLSVHRQFAQRRKYILDAGLRATARVLPQN